MNLVRFRGPAAELFPPLRRQINRLFGDFLGEGALPEDLGTGAWAPVVDVGETAEAVVVKAELPGINAKDIELTVNDDTLTLAGKREETKEEKGKTWHRVERSCGAFLRTIALPASVEGTRAEAESRDGLLTITIPKKKEAISKKVEIKAK